MNTLIHRVRYYQLLQQRNIGLHTHENILEKVQYLDGVTWGDRDEGEIKHRLRLTWKSLDDHMAKIVKKREDYLHELSCSTDCTDHKKALKQIRTREASKRQFRRICTTLGRLKSGGLAGVDIPLVADNGEITGWQSVTAPDELNEVITQRNRQHLHQAAPTPVGHGKGYDLFHGQDQHDTARKVLGGQLK